MKHTCRNAAEFQVKQNFEYISSVRQNFIFFFFLKPKQLNFGISSHTVNATDMNDADANHAAY